MMSVTIFSVIILRVSGPPHMDNIRTAWSYTEHTAVINVEPPGLLALVIHNIWL